MTDQLSDDELHQHRHLNTEADVHEPDDSKIAYGREETLADEFDAKVKHRPSGGGSSFWRGTSEPTFASATLKPTARARESTTAETPPRNIHVVRCVVVFCTFMDVGYCSTLRAFDSWIVLTNFVLFFSCFLPV